jgi:UDP-N-acetylglucosamine--N-acetylmuramyl-(pentapeptide) pyrophosphoryl-undecaprenol N-acetylglucosamine transferase
MPMNKTIILTGGGTAGHVAPNLALIPPLVERGYEIHYLGEKGGFEEQLTKNQPVTFHPIRAGKLRRYFSLKNFTDPFRVIAGYFDAKKVIRRIKPDAVFSKGGFVTVPVCAAGKRCGVPVVIHESDYTPGLANRLGMRFAKKVLVTFEDTLAHTRGKGIFTGTPIRPAVFSGRRERGLAFLGFSGERPVLLVMGGSQGASALNDAVRSALPKLLERFDIAHLCGRGKLDESLENQKGYRQFEYLNDELPDVFAAADIALSRAGANSIFEFLALSLPALLVPLPLSQSRGDQIQNADYFKKRGYAEVLFQENMTEETLTSALFRLYEQRETYRATMDAEPNKNGLEAVLKHIVTAAEGR